MKFGICDESFSNPLTDSPLFDDHKNGHVMRWSRDAKKGPWNWKNHWVRTDKMIWWKWEVFRAQTMKVPDSTPKQEDTVIILHIVQKSCWGDHGKKAGENGDQLLRYYWKHIESQDLVSQVEFSQYGSEWSRSQECADRTRYVAGKDNVGLRTPMITFRSDLFWVAWDRPYKNRSTGINFANRNFYLHQRNLRLGDRRTHRRPKQAPVPKSRPRQHQWPMCA